MHRTNPGRFSLVWLLTGILIGCQPQPPVGKTFLQAAVVTAHPLATAVGVQILQDGGNAVDAMVGVHFALAVVYPQAGNLGGGGFMVQRDADGRVHTLNFREKAPMAAYRDMYLDSLGNAIGELSRRGHLAVGVPGSVAGMWAAHDSLGQLPWPRLVQPAIALAAQGFPLTKKEAEALNAKLETFRAYNRFQHPLWEAEAWQPGDSIRLPALARTLIAVRDSGTAGFYAGWVADSIVAEMQGGTGIMTHDDLQAYDASWQAPIRGNYRGHEIISMGPPSSGGVALMQLLRMIEPYPLGEYGWHSPEAIHLMAEAERRVYADRAKHLGDPDFWPVPVAQLLDSAYLRERMAGFSPTQATPSDSIEAGAFSRVESPQTTHYSIVDADGMAVAVTTTLNSGYGSGVMVQGAGFFLNNEMDDFSAKPGVPNIYGLLGAEANAVAPGKRMLSSMTPTIVTQGDSLLMVVGTPGGATIITSVFQNIVNVIDHGMGMQASVEAPRFHHQWRPDQISYEAGGFPAKTAQALEQLGHTLATRRAIGRVDAILVLPNGHLETGADPRGDDFADGF